MDSLESKVSIVTGAGSGIGRAISLRLANEGSTVVIVDINRASGIETVRQIQNLGQRAEFCFADMSNESDVRKMIAFTVQQFNGFDILVNNAGIAPEPYYPSAKPTHWSRTIKVNLIGTMLAIHFGIDVLASRGGGSIVNISSMAGFDYRPYTSPEYAASKAAVIRLTTALANLKDELGIRINCICPGWVETEEVKHYIKETPLEMLKKESFPPPEKLIKPADIANLVVLLSKDESLSGRIIVWPDGEPWRLLPSDYRPF